ncbi:killer cell lectin-like receptor subfamily F member 1 isoform X2 [Tupaia chinensis]|nr:killer cell lectin-like receptor subfamily F member 1 isoform X2 [Tupaia chinensis]
MIIPLLLAVIVLSVLVIQFNSARHTKVDDEPKDRPCTEGLKSGTNTSIVSWNSSTTHKSCPSGDWKLFGGKCYWISESMQSWTKSQRDCAMKNSNLMIIQDFIDMSFLWLHLNSHARYWIGLTFPSEGNSWIWVDNSSFDSHLLTIKKYSRWTRSTKCAHLSGNIIAEQNCDYNFRWICQQ